MSTQEVYNNIYSQNIEFIRSGNIIKDDYLSSGRADKRLGISLVIPIKGIGRKYSFLIELFKKYEPDLYYYPFSDIHVTVFNYIEASSNYIKSVDVEKNYIRVTREVLREEAAFPIEFKGIVFSRQAGIIQGYDKGRLISIRNKIRILLKEYSIKYVERYKTESAHITFCRFARGLKEPERLAGMIKENRHIDIGTEIINNIELIEHDWYNQQLKKRIIEVLKI